MTLADIEALQRKHAEQMRATDLQRENVQAACRVIALETERVCRAMTDAMWGPLLSDLRNMR